VKPSDVQALLDERITVPTRNRPRIVLDEVDGDEVVVRIFATPELAADGPQLADEVLTAVAEVASSESVTSPSGARTEAMES
jgi:small conductance mechanosensitive channel